MIWQYGVRRWNCFAKYQTKCVINLPFLTHFILVIPMAGWVICWPKKKFNMVVMNQRFPLIHLLLQEILQNQFWVISQEKCNLLSNNHNLKIQS